MSARLRRATPADLPVVERFLLDVGLITAGVPEHIGGFLLAEEDGKIVGSAALERYGTQGLLRSVAVSPEHRNRGLARDLVLRILDDAARAEVLELYLFTDTAPAYFRRFGFIPVGREDVAEPVRASAEYGACCSDAQAMVLRLRDQRRRNVRSQTSSFEVGDVADPSR